MYFAENNVGGYKEYWMWKPRKLVSKHQPRHFPFDLSPFCKFGCFICGIRCWVDKTMSFSLDKQWCCNSKVLTSEMEAQKSKSESIFPGIMQTQKHLAYNRIGHSLLWLVVQSTYFCGKQANKHQKQKLGAVNSHETAPVQSRGEKSAWKKWPKQKIFWISDLKLFKIERTYWSIQTDDII